MCHGDMANFEDFPHDGPAAVGRASHSGPDGKFDIAANAYDAESN